MARITQICVIRAICGYIQSETLPQKARTVRFVPSVAIPFRRRSVYYPQVQPKKPQGPSLFAVLKPYKHLILLLVVLTILGNSLNLAIPAIISSGIDTYSQQHIIASRLIVEFFVAAAGIFIFAYLQTVTQTYASERVARD